MMCAAWGIRVRGVERDEMGTLEVGRKGETVRVT